MTPAMTPGSSGDVTFPLFPVLLCFHSFFTYQIYSINILDPIIFRMKRGWIALYSHIVSTFLVGLAFSPLKLWDVYKIAFFLK